MFSVKITSIFKEQETKQNTQDMNGQDKSQQADEQKMGGNAVAFSLSWEESEKNR